MRSYKFGNAIISEPDYVNQSIEVEGRTWWFDFDKRLGPLWLRKDGEARKCQCPTNKKVWDAFEEWLRNTKG